MVLAAADGVPLDPASLGAAAEAMTVVEDGNHVVASALGSEPRYLLAALKARAVDLRDVRLSAGMLLSGYDVLQGNSMRFTTWFSPGTLTGESQMLDRIEYLPMSWFQVVEWLRTRAAIDVALIQVSPRDEAGFHSLGVSSSYGTAAVEAAGSVIAEVNQQMPQTFGARIHESVFAATVHVDYPIAAFPSPEPDEVDHRIADLVCTLLPPEPTIQVGVGGIPDAVLVALAKQGRENIRIHSVFTKGAMRLHRAGAISPAAGSMNVGEVLGDREVYEFVHRHPDLRMVGAEGTHSPSALLEVPRFCAVNSALSVDLYGQLNTEYLAGRHMGAVGGLADFAHAGTWPGNMSIIALRSSARNGTISRIVSQLSEPTVSISRDLVQFVVTEHGVADLRGKSVSERAGALVDVAAPEHRAQLKAGIS
ncbi:MAG: hypothetical protein JWR85_1827 [Marmoricola sp.]|nr:hypothetical protein [Marmoricola sp.]